MFFVNKNQFFFHRFGCTQTLCWLSKPAASSKPQRSAVGRGGRGGREEAGGKGRGERGGGGGGAAAAPMVVLVTADVGLGVVADELLQCGVVCKVSVCMCVCVYVCICMY